MVQDKLWCIKGLTKNPNFLYFRPHREEINSEGHKNFDKAVELQTEAC